MTKAKIFIIQALDWILFLAVISFGVYSVLYSEKPELMAITALFGLFLVAKFGDYTKKKIARFQVDERIERNRLGKTRR